MSDRIDSQVDRSSVTIKAVGMLLRKGFERSLGATVAVLVAAPWLSAAPATSGIGLCDAQHNAE